jgi:hypothetical protein
MSSMFTVLWEFNGIFTSDLLRNGDDVAAFIQCGFRELKKEHVCPMFKLDWDSMLANKRDLGLVDIREFCYLRMSRPSSNYT